VKCCLSGVDESAGLHIGGDRTQNHYSPSEPSSSFGFIQSHRREVLRTSNETSLTTGHAPLVPNGSSNFSLNMWMKGPQATNPTSSATSAAMCLSCVSPGSTCTFLVTKSSFHPKWSIVPGHSSGLRQLKVGMAGPASQWLLEEANGVIQV
jgi:hypothetical protein